MPGLKDPARAARERLLRREQQAQARAEAAAVAAGVAETVALSRARGAAIEAPSPGARLTPYRRRTGLDWLAGKGRIDAAAKAAGERYGEAYRRARRTPAIASTLEVAPGRQRGAPDIAIEQICARAQANAIADRRLAGLRARLFRQPDLVNACDLVCGEELTPREAAGSERDAGRLEAVLKVALDILAAGGGEP